MQVYISPKTRQKYNKENRKSLTLKDFRFLFRDSGLSLCEAFSLPPRAIIETEANRHSADADAVFCAPSSLTKASFRRSAVPQKNRATFGCAICSSFVIRLGEIFPFSMKIPTFQMKLKPCINRSKSAKYATL